MHVLRIGADWARQIDTLRNAVTEDTNLIRFDNGFYRICKAGTDLFRVQLVAGSGGSTLGVALTMQARDLYVADINGRRFERYASTLEGLRPSASALEAAVHALPRAVGDKLFELQSLLVFCVAESLRSDRIATAIDQAIRSSQGGLLGVGPSLPMAQLMIQARNWGQGSNAVHGALSAEAKKIVAQPRSALTPQQRQFSERVDLSRVDAALQEAARGVKVLKLPG